MTDKRKKDIEELSIFRKRRLKLPMTEEENRQYKDYMAEWFKSQYKTTKGRAKTLLKSAKSSSKNKQIKFDLDEKWIEDILIEGKCQVSGIPFSFESMNTGKWGHGSQNPFGPSLDRTDPFGGYTKDNVKVVVWIYNVGKQNNTHEDIMTLARALVNKNV